MSITDPIADLLTRIRNANRMRFSSVDVMMSRLNTDIARVLEKHGYIKGFEEKSDPETHHPRLRIYLRYLDAKKGVVTDLQRVSRPSRRVYVKSTQIPRVFNGYGIAIISTSKGVMTDSEAREMNVGGEVLCKVW